MVSREHILILFTLFLRALDAGNNDIILHVEYTFTEKRYHGHLKP